MTLCVVQVVVPRPLVASESKYLELAFDRQQFVTPLVLVYHPKTKHRLQRIEIHFEYAGTKILSMSHKTVYDASGGGPSDRVLLTLQSYWHEHASRDVSSGARFKGCSSCSVLVPLRLFHTCAAGMSVLLIGSFVVAGLIIVVVLADECMRARVFIKPASEGRPGGSSHSSSPQQGRDRRQYLGGADESSSESTPRTSLRADASPVHPPAHAGDHDVHQTAGGDINNKAKDE